MNKSIIVSSLVYNNDNHYAIYIEQNCKNC